MSIRSDISDMIGSLTDLHKDLETGSLTADVVKVILEGLVQILEGNPVGSNRIWQVRRSETTLTTGSIVGNWADEDLARKMAKSKKSYKLYVLDHDEDGNWREVPI